MKQYRIVPRPGFEWGVEYNEEGLETIWNVLTITRMTPRYFVSSVAEYDTQAAAEIEIQSRISRDRKKAPDYEHMKTPPRIYP